MASKVFYSRRDVISEGSDVFTFHHDNLLEQQADGRYQIAQDQLNSKADKTTTVNGKALSGNVTVTTQDIPDRDLVVDTIAALRDCAVGLNGLASNVARVRGYYSSLDGGGGEFVWTNDITTVDDGGVTVVPTELPRLGCWKRVSWF
jgi:hypothetical protein